MNIHALFSSRVLRGPEDDAGFDYDEDFTDGQEVDDLPDPDAGDDDADAGDEAGGDADHLQDLPVGEDEGQTDGQAEVRKPSRAQARVEQALREAREAKAELERIRAERAQADQQRLLQQSQREEQERLALMDPEERYEYKARQLEARTEQRIQALQFQLEDRADKTAFEALAARNPAVAKLAPQVEEYLATMRRNGTTAPRETVVKYLLGERALSNAGAAKTKATRQAAVNKQRQQARPTGGRSDVSAGSSRSGGEAAKRAERLANLII